MRITRSGMLTLINPVERAEAIDHPERLFAPKFDGFRTAAATRSRPVDLAKR